MKNFFKKISAWFRKSVSPAFLLMLLLSTILWYLTKLGYTYTAAIPVSVDIEGNRFKVECMAEGTGYRIVAHRFLKHKTIAVPISDLNITPSVLNEGWFTISPHSLQNAISLRNSDIRIISIESIPDIIIYNRP